LKYFLAILAMLSSVSAWPETPAPRGMTFRQPLQTNVNCRPQPAAAEQCPGARSPVVLNLVPAPRTAEETARIAQERDEKRAFDREIIELSRYILIFTAIIAFCAVVMTFAALWRTYQARGAAKRE
jgi:hypothetical protein